MGKGLFRRKKNNSGSTIVIVLLMTSFVLILATLITTTTMVNLRMKIAASQSTKSFYTAEEAVDEIYAALGKTSMQSFNKAYEEQLTKLFSTSAVNGTTVVVDNKKANKNLREGYISNLIDSFSITRYNPKEVVPYEWNDTTDVKDSENPEKQTEREKFVGKLNSYIEGDESALNVKSIKTLAIEVATTGIIDNSSAGGATQANLPIYTVKFTDCVVEYKDDKSGNYSYITFDGAVGLPDIYVDFKDEVPAGTLFFSNFSLIGNAGISFNGVSGVNISGNAYAGVGDNTSSSNGFYVNGSNMTFSGKYLVCGGKLNIKDASNVTLSGNQVWADNIVVGSSDTVTISSHVYANDDTTIEGNNSDVTFSSSYEGYGTGNNNDSADNNSSVIINGESSNIKFSSALSKLVIAGRAYVAYKDSSGNKYDIYPTGESYSVNINQEIYLIPKTLIRNGSNPSKSDDTSFSVKITEDNFFGYDLLATDTQYVSKAVKNEETGNIEKYYYYFNFKDSDSRNRYAELINDSDKFDDYISGFSSDRKRKAVALRAEILKSVVSTNSKIDSPTAKSNKIVFADSSDITNMRLYFNTTRKDRINRYDVFSKILMPLSKEDVLNSDEMSALTTSADKYLTTAAAESYLNSMQVGTDISHGIELNKYVSKDVFYNVINTDGKNGFNDFTKYVTGDSNNGAFLKIVDGKVVVAINSTVGTVIITQESELKMTTDGNDIRLTIPSTTGGIIVCSGNVDLECDYNGILLSNKVISVGNNCTVKNTYFSDEKGEKFKNFIENNRESLKKQIPGTEQYKYFEDIFRFWNASKEERDDGSLNVADMTYKDMVTFSQWRKYEEE